MDYWLFFVEEFRLLLNKINVYLINARPCTLMRVYPFSSQRKRSKFFLPTLHWSFIVCFHMSGLRRYCMKSHTFWYVLAYFTLKHPKTLMETTVYNAFFITFFKSIRFHLSTLETGRFRKNAFSKGSTFETVFESVRFLQRFRSF